MYRKKLHLLIKKKLRVGTEIEEFESIVRITTPSIQKAEKGMDQTLTRRLYIACFYSPVTRASPWSMITEGNTTTGWLQPFSPSVDTNRYQPARFRVLLARIPL